MQITAADWSLGSGHALGTRRVGSAHLQTWVGARPQTPATAVSTPVATVDARAGSVANDPASSLMDQLARRARLLQAAAPAAVASPSASPESADADAQTASGDPRTDQIKLILEKLFGIKHIANLDLRVDASHTAMSASQATGQATQSAGSPGSAGWGMSYDYQETYAESEVMALKAQGTFTTDDGRSFAVNLDYRMERTYVEQHSVSVRAGDAVTRDPLVLDLSGMGGGFSSATAPVDLHGDGTTSALPMPAAGSWYLLRNAQVPTTGKDLFGPTTGQGFQELAALDQDGNGFVDSGDPAFASLHLWNGQGAPASLATMGVGAIATRSVAAPFRYADAGNMLQGLNRRSGIYLTEDGRAGAVHQVDVAG